MIERGACTSSWPEPRGRPLASAFAVGWPAASEHLQVLRTARLVREEPRGRERYYHLDPRPLSDDETWLRSFTRYEGWPGVLGRLEGALAG